MDQKFKRLHLSRRFQLPPPSAVHAQLSHSGYGTIANEFSERSIKVLVWNVYKGKLPHWRDSFIELSHNKDLILVQEAYENSDLKTAIRALSPVQVDMARSFVYQKNGIATGVLTAARAESHRVQAIISSARESIYKTPKSALLTHYYFSKSELAVMNVHCINYVSSQVYLSQIHQIRDALLGHHGPLLLAGDFNPWSRKKNQLLQELRQSLSLEEVIFSDGEKRLKTLGYPLDFAFIRGMHAKEAHVLDHIRTSDHKALSFTLELD